jgi:hypothetical protein|uniref:Uncharacterized protein n=1 Tax=uncultured bacterium 32o03 TaxID=1701362 RepID=A0A0M3Q0Z7_9BACT|nr:hypothetical protein [uncultured bacterium 32o03]
MRHKEEIKRKKKKCNSKQTAIKKLSFFMRKMRGKERER